MFGHNTCTSHEERVYLHPVQHWTVCSSGTQWSWPFLLLRPVKAVNILQVSETFWPTDFGCFEPETVILCLFSFRPWDCVTASTRVPLWVNLKSIVLLWLLELHNVFLSSRMCCVSCAAHIQRTSMHWGCSDLVSCPSSLRPHSEVVWVACDHIPSIGVYVCVSRATLKMLNC